MFFNRENTLPENELPTLTLFTKYPCPLCDELMHELNPYLNRVKFETTDITKKENVRYLRLYRYEIPVLFLNGQYLCKHVLDKRLLEERLQLIENKDV